MNEKSYDMAGKQKRAVTMEKSYKYLQLEGTEL